MVFGSSGSTSVGKNGVYSVLRRWSSNLSIMYNGVKLTERTHVEDYEDEYPSNLDDAYGTNVDGDYKITATFIGLSTGNYSHITTGVRVSGVYGVGVAGVNSYSGCLAWLQCEVYSSGNAPHGLYSLGNFQQAAISLGYDETL